MSRVRSIDWLRGFVMVLMTVDHSGQAFDAAHMHGDSAARWVVGSALPAGEFLTRWVTHLCAPAFVLLAGVSLALSSEKRKDDPGQTRFIITRGLLIAALDPIWMSLGFAAYERIVFQVLYAIGLSLVCMAALRKLPSVALAGGALAIQLFGELSGQWRPVEQPWHALWGYLFVGGPVWGRAVAAYPLVPWLSMMMLGWVVGRWLLTPMDRQTRARWLMLGGASLLALFGVVRGIDGYGNWGLHREGPGVLQWLHVAKYPPSLSYTALELGIALVLWAALMWLDDPLKPRKWLAPLSLFGSTAFFFYLLHVHLLSGFQALTGMDKHADGLVKTWVGAAAVVLLLAWPCAWYRRYKVAHPDGWARYV